MVFRYAGDSLELASSLGVRAFIAQRNRREICQCAEEAGEEGGKKQAARQPGGRPGLI